ncbi:THO complex subunit 4D-like isoform X3 [Amaranthus tricolor]|uniref:THO complex subunit 4D-like isoform X3 n=1 Tax=Amaranthus tricolor TaxID=29722 RepID=UPI0025869997|nr:THO complex subunit 4D-like isoform X3 [Amaranthus tricolor]
MDKALDMSLDDIIKSKKSAGRGRGRGGYSRGRGAGGGYSHGHGARGGSFSGGRMRGVGRGARQQGSLGVNARHSSFTIAKSFRRSKNVLWEHDLFEESLTSAGIPTMESGTELFITNLDTGVSNDDIRDLFSEIGELKRYAMHYDKNGEPNGSAEVVYVKRSDAFAAHRRYNNVLLDGRPMRIEIASLSSGLPLAARVNVVGGANRKATRRVMTHNRSHTNFSAQRNGDGLLMLMIRFCCNERIVELLADLKIRIYSPCNQARKDSVNDKDYCNKAKNKWWV